MILLVTVSEAKPPRTTNSIDPAVCKAKVVEVLKGVKSLRSVEFRYLSPGDFQLSVLPNAGQTYFVFLHKHDGRYWVLEGPFGIRPIERTYRESRYEGEKLVKETYDHAEFVSAIRRLAKTR